jgi:predicted nucleic-acid-binding protein
VSPRERGVDSLFVDTNVFIRYLTNDDPEKADRVEHLLKLTVEGKAALVTNLMVIAELVWTLESYYGLSRSDVAEKLSIILNTPNLEVPDRQRILKALSLYVEKNIYFIDSYNAFFARDQGISTILTYDKKHFNRIDWLKRVEP